MCLFVQFGLFQKLSAYLCTPHQELQFVPVQVIIDVDVSFNRTQRASGADIPRQSLANENRELDARNRKCVLMVALYVQGYGRGGKLILVIGFPGDKDAQHGFGGKSSLAEQILAEFLLVWPQVYCHIRPELTPAVDCGPPEHTRCEIG